MCAIPLGVPKQLIKQLTVPACHYGLNVSCPSEASVFGH